MRSLLLILVISFVSIEMITTQWIMSVNATAENTDTITCQYDQGTTMSGTIHLKGNCQGDNGYTVHGGAFNADSKACEGHMIKGPYDNSHFRGACINK